MKDTFKWISKYLVGNFLWTSHKGLQFRNGTETGKNCARKILLNFIVLDSKIEHVLYKANTHTHTYTYTHTHTYTHTNTNTHTHTLAYTCSITAIASQWSVLHSHDPNNSICLPLRIEWEFMKTELWRSCINHKESNRSWCLFRATDWSTLNCSSIPGGSKITFCSAKRPSEETSGPSGHGFSGYRCLLPLA